MTNRTISMINDFAETMKINDIPAIIMAMQEEDNVSNVLPFPNMFKRFRNMCAHESANFVEQLQKAVNKDCAVLSFTAQSIDNFTVQLHQFTAWMFSMYEITGTPEYIQFWYTFCKIICPATASKRYAQSMKLGLTADKDISDWLIEFEQKVSNLYDEMSNYNPEDGYFNRIYVENKQLFLRVMIPNLSSIVCMFITGQVDCCNRENIAGYLRLYVEREVPVNEREAL